MGIIKRCPSMDFLGKPYKCESDVIPYLVEVSLGDSTQDAYLTIKETLSRIGVSSKFRKTLFQTCHILSKRDRFYICHFKMLFALTNCRKTDITTGDIARQNKIVDLLDQWGLCKIIDRTQVAGQCGIGSVKIVKYADKDNWKFEQKYIFRSERGHE